ncbi:unnamed protein product [Diplocarpon coronariae]
MIAGIPPFLVLTVHYHRTSFALSLRRAANPEETDYFCGYMADPRGEKKRKKEKRKKKKKRKKEKKGKKRKKK